MDNVILQHTQAQCDQNVQRAADVAVKKTFFLLGVDVDDPLSVECFREDLRFGHKIRKMFERLIIAAVGIVATTMAYMLAEYIRRHP